MKRNIFRLFNITLALLLCVAMLAGCSNKGSDKDSDVVATKKPSPENLIGQISVMGYITDVNDTRLNDYVLEFQSQYSSVDVQVFADLFMDDYFVELDESVENGTVSDVFLVDDVRMAKYASEGKILDLTPYITNYTDFELGETVHPSTELFASAYNSSLYKDKLYMGAVEYYHNFVFVNYKLLEDAGCSAPGDTWTWDDLISDARVIKENCNIDKPIVMDYTDYSIWGAFARNSGDDLLSDIGTTDVDGINFTSPEIVEGFESLAKIVDSNLVYESSGSDIDAKDLSKYAFVVADHTDLVKWKDYLLSDECDFEWDYMHFPRWNVENAETTESSEENTAPSYYQSIGSHSYGFAVYLHEDSEKYNQEHYDMCAQLALYGLVDDAVEEYVSDGSVVPANKAVNAQRFWRGYPIEGKNSSVFSHFADSADFSASLTSIMSVEAAAEVDIKKIMDDYLKNGIPFVESLQKLQDKINANMGDY